MPVLRPGFLRNLFLRILGNEDMKTLSIMDLYSVYKPQDKELLIVDVREDDEIELAGAFIVLKLQTVGFSYFRP
jgi:hypothetical protein